LESIRVEAAAAYCQMYQSCEGGLTAPPAV
jgi:hypothetical protein